jgi:hypothetical protein
MGLFARVIGVIMSPRETFEHVVAHPRPAGVLLVVVAAMSLATMVPMLLSEEMRQAALQMQAEMTERFTGQPLSPDAYAALERRMGYGVYLTPINFLIGLPIMSLIFSALYWVAFNAVLGGTASFKQVLAIVTHSQVIGGLGAVLAAPIQYAQGRMTPSGPFTLGGLLPFLPEGSVWAWVFGTLSVFMLWGLIVTAIGLAVLYRRNARNIAIALIVTYLMVAAAVFSIFGRFMGTGR